MKFFEMVCFHMMTTHEVSHGHTWPPRQFLRMPCLPAQLHVHFAARKMGWEVPGGTECLHKGKIISEPATSTSPSCQWSWPSYGFCSFPYGSIGTQHTPVQQESTCFIRGTWWKPQKIQLHCWVASLNLFLRDEIWSWFSLSHDCDFTQW